MWDVTDLKVAKAQKTFVASNTISILEAYTAIGTECTAFPFAIYNDAKPVGFVMIGHNVPWAVEHYDLPADIYYIWRFMIDKRYQGRGYGRQAFALALDFVRTFPCGRSDLCWLSYEPENVATKNLYASFGFVEAPKHYKEGQEMPALLAL